jgi:hypothetical protein
MAKKIARQHHDPQECDYNLQNYQQKFNSCPNNKMAQWQSKMSMDFNTK